MQVQIEELLKTHKYNIYDNLHIKDEDIEVIAEALMKDPAADMIALFDLTKCSSKFCWFNYLRILERMSWEERVKGMPLLFELLQDENWPTFEKTIELIKTMKKDRIVPYYKYYLELAYREDDEMWISGLKKLAEEIDIG